MLQEHLDFNILAAYLQEFQFFNSRDFQFRTAFINNLIDTLLLVDNLFFDLGLMMLHFAFIVYFHFFLQICHHVFLFNLGLGFLQNIIWEYFNARDQISIHFVQGTYSEPGECQSEKIVLKDLCFIRHSISRNFWFMDFKHHPIPRNSIDWFDTPFSKLLSLVDASGKSDQIIECLC